MKKAPDLTRNEVANVGREIENGLEFTRDVLTDPSILEQITQGATVKAIPKAERDPDVRYDIETPRMLAIVIPPEPEQPETAAPGNAPARRIERDDASRLRRIRAAHR